jgi:putative ABC transport system permease protein
MSRAHRINLNMLALVSLLTGSLLLFATQSLSILRRRTSLGLLRALGVTRRGLQIALFGEGVAIGALGSLLGVVLGHALAATLLSVFPGGFSPGQQAGADADDLPLRPAS